MEGTYVVQDDQCFAGAEQAPEQRGPLVGIRRYLGGADSEGAQEAVEHGGGGHRRVLLVVPPQIGEELAVRELVGDLARPVHRECGLAHPAHADDGRQRRGVRVVGLLQEPVQGGHLPLPAGECHHVRGQLCRDGAQGRRRGRRRGGGPGQFGGVAQDQFVQLTQSGTRFDPELLGE